MPHTTSPPATQTPPERRRPPKVPRPHPLRRGVSPTLTRVREQARHDPAAVAEFIANTRLPLVEPAGHPRERLVSFCWHDPEAEEVLLFANRLTDETRLEETLLSRLPGTDLWTLSVVMESDWRASYAFLVRRSGEPAPWLAEGDQVRIRAALDRGRRDPANPVTCRNRAGVQQSVVALPDADPQPHLVRRDAAPRGTAQTLPGHPRVTAWVSTPAPEAQAPLVVVLDGEVWHDGPHDLTATLDNLVAGQVLPPLRALFVSSGGRDQRWSELADDGTTYLTDSLLPLAHERGWLADDPHQVAVIGQSLGGLTALRLGLRRPDLCGTVLSQSASLWLDELDVEIGALADVLPRIHLAHGRQEWVLAGPHERLVEKLRAAGVVVQAHEVNGGHDYAWWRGTVADALVWALGR